MRRGVTFKIPQKKDNVLYKILNCINVQMYVWYNIENQNESWSCTCDSKERYFLEKNCYDGEVFFQEILEDYYVIALKLQAYLKSKEDFFEIHTYEEFQNSTCQILLLIYDCEFVEIYAKEQSVISAMYDNARKNNFMEIEYITDVNDGRKEMDIS